MVTGQGEGRELPGYVVQPKKQTIQGGVHSGGKHTRFHFCSELSAESSVYHSVSLAALAYCTVASACFELLLEVRANA